MKLRGKGVKTMDMIKKCQRCNLEFECKELSSCWCFQETGVGNDEIQFDNCVCKKCLQLQYRERLFGV